MSLGNLDVYTNVGNYGALTDASPHRVVQVVLDTLATRIAQAKGHIERGETAAKNELIGKAIALIEGLVISLDAEKGGEIAAHLEQLYDYMSRRLLEANLHDRTEYLDEVAELVDTIRLSWARIAPEAG